MESDKGTCVHAHTRTCKHTRMRARTHTHTHTHAHTVACTRVYNVHDQIGSTFLALEELLANEHMKTILHDTVFLFGFADLK